jgi:hypothetical protein
MLRIAVAVATLALMPAIALADDYGLAPAFSIAKVVRESRACWPAVSNNCITLKEGEEVIVGQGRQLSDLNPRRGNYCLRPAYASVPANVPCYFADLTAIEINGKAPPAVRMASDEERQMMARAGDNAACEAQRLAKEQHNPALMPVLPPTRPCVEASAPSRPAAGFTTNKLLEFCRSLVDWKRLACQTYVTATRDTYIFMAITNMKSDRRSEIAGICAPSNVVFMTDDLILWTEKLVAEWRVKMEGKMDPMGEMNAAAVILAAIRDRYPCK